MLAFRFRRDLQPSEGLKDEHHLGAVPVDDEAHGGRHARPHAGPGQLLAQQSHAQEEQDEGAQEARPHMVPLHPSPGAQHSCHPQSLLSPPYGRHPGAQV